MTKYQQALDALVRNIYALNVEGNTAFIKSVEYEEVKGRWFGKNKYRIVNRLEFSLCTGCITASRWRDNGMYFSDFECLDPELKDKVLEEYRKLRKLILDTNQKNKENAVNRVLNKL
jgi:hypothetical protein